jgi:hypothetical protein
MACKLSSSEDPKADFEGRVGSEVEIAVNSDSGGAFAVSAEYPPPTKCRKNPSGTWSFTILSGYNQLGLLVENPKAGDGTRIVEVCERGTTNTLRQFNFDPQGPTQFFSIKGLQ